MAQTDRPATDRELIRETLRGATEAYAALMRRHQEGIYHYLLATLREAGPARELTLQTFHRAYRLLDRLEPDRPFDQWLHRMAINLSLSAMRRQASGLSASTAAAMSPEEAIEALSPLQRAVLALRHMAGLSYEEIASRTALPPESVMAALGEARRQLILWMPSPADGRSGT